MSPVPARTPRVVTLALLAGLWACAGLTAACGDDGGTSDTTVADTGDSTSTDTSASTSSATGSEGTSTSSGAEGSSGGVDSTGAVCEIESAIVTDIDETLTISDEEFLMQLGDGNYDPIEREGAAEMISAYYDLGYRVMYLTARAEVLMVAGTGETAREATDRWLEEHGFPVDPAGTMVVLAPELVVGPAVEAYKAEALAMQQAAGWRFDYAYGNATTDIGAYAQAGIALDATFIIGEQAGVGGTVAVPGEGWVEHTAAHLPTVPEVCGPQ